MKQRPCLKCDCEFASESIGHRICDKCKEHKAYKGSQPYRLTYGIGNISGLNKHLLVTKLIETSEEKDK